MSKIFLAARTQFWLLPAAVAVLLGGVLLPTHVKADIKLTQSAVRGVCGDNLQEGGGAFGCTFCKKSGCTDYSCNFSGQGRQGCWRTPIERSGMDTKDVGNPVTGVKSVNRQSNPTGIKTSVSGPLSSSAGTKGLTAPPSALSQPGLLGASSTGSGGTTGGTFKRPTTTAR